LELFNRLQVVSLLLATTPETIAKFMSETLIPDTERMEALIDEMSVTIKNLSSLATAHGLIDPYVNRELHDAMEGHLIEKPVDEILDKLKKVNKDTHPEWSFLNVG
jgi:hypothetical protein